MRVIIEYKDVEKKLVRNNLQVISMTSKEDNCIYILKHGQSQGNYLSLKNMLSIDILED